MAPAHRRQGIARRLLTRALDDARRAESLKVRLVSCLGMADLGYEGEADLLRIPIKKPAGGTLTIDQQTYNAVHSALRCRGERANSLLKTTFKALRRWRGCPWRIGRVVAAALVVLHHEHNRTT